MKKEILGTSDAPPPSTQSIVLKIVGFHKSEIPPPDKKLLGNWKLESGTSTFLSVGRKKEKGYTKIIIVKMIFSFCPVFD